MYNGDPQKMIGNQGLFENIIHLPLYPLGDMELYPMCIDILHLTLELTKRGHLLMLQCIKKKDIPAKEAERAKINSEVDKLRRVQGRMTDLGKEYNECVMKRDRIKLVYHQERHNLDQFVKKLSKKTFTKG